MKEKSVIRWWAQLAVGGALLASAIAHAGHGEETATMNLGEGGLAIQGYDAVAYFTESDAVKGDAQHQYEWRGATWHFASSKHRALFIANPQKYAPQYGGFCALGVSLNAAVVPDPEAWTIVDGRLFLNYNMEARDRWRTEQDAHIANADKAWSQHGAAQ